MELALILGLVLLFLHFILGVLLRWYEEYIVFGPVVHFVGGLFLGALTHYWGLALLLAVAWEAFEAIFDLLFPTRSDLICWHSRSWYGAARDIFWSGLGILVILSII